jgi:hypothetical protein
MKIDTITPRTVVKRAMPLTGTVHFASTSVLTEFPRRAQNFSLLDVGIVDIGYRRANIIEFTFISSFNFTVPCTNNASID